MRRRNLAVLVSLSLMGTMSMTGYAASEKETTTEAASTEAGSTEAESKSADQEAADKVADLIDAIYVQREPIRPMSSVRNKGSVGRID